MADLILGVGRNKTLPDIVSLAETELRKVAGLPRTIVGRGASFTIRAERDTFDVGFQSYSVAISDGDPCAAKLEQFAKDHQAVCALASEDSSHVLSFTPLNKGDEKQITEAMTALPQAVPMPEVWRVHGEHYRVDPISTELLFQAMLQYKASDVHLSPGQPPIFRVDNEVRNSDLLGNLSGSQIRALVKEISSDRDWAQFNDEMQTSFGYHQVGLGYSRISAFIKSGAPHCTIRFLPEVIPSFEDLNIPRDTMVSLAKQHHGLVLATGMTGSGKSTTVAAMVDWINSNKPCHILTIENPVEYVHSNKKAIVSQRSTGTDVRDFFEAVTGALRHDPDVIVIGEMRDPDTIRSAINAAATGHLVVSTLHANTASEVVNRIVSFFDPVERDLVKLQLRDCLRCVICQRLLPKTGGGRIPALEIMLNDIKPINDGIIAGDTDAIRIGMQQTVSHSFLFEQYMYGMYKEKKISLEVGQAHSTDQSIFDQLLMGTYSVPRLDAIKGKQGGAGSRGGH